MAKDVFCVKKTATGLKLTLITITLTARHYGFSTSMARRLESWATNWDTAPASRYI